MATPQPSEEILAWAKGQPDWRQDALRRLLTKSFAKADEDECLELLKAAQDIVQSKLKADPLDKKHLPVRSSSATNLRLVELDAITNVNRLSKDAALSLSADGLTLIYGDNGSGKSGFIRILKKAGRARDDENILPDVYSTSKAKSPASARFTLHEGKAAQPPVTWLDDGKPSVDVLSRLAIFDSKCASVHVDGENRLEIIPHNLDCFEKLAQLCDRLRARLKEECDALEKQLLGALPPILTGTTSEKFVAELSRKKEKDLAAATAWTDADLKRLTDLAGMLKDPMAEAQRLERIAAALETYVNGIASASRALADPKIAEILLHKKSAQELRAQSNASASAAFALDPLKGVGEGLWRTMFDAAKAYSEQYAFPGEPFPVTKADAQCVLCQQTLDADAQDRFSRFASFVTGAMNAKASAAEAARDAAILAIRPVTLPIAELAAEARDNLLARLKQLVDDSTAYRDALLKRRHALLQDGDPLVVLPANPDARLCDEILSLVTAAKEARALASADTGAADILRKEHAELSGRKILRDNQAELKRRIDIYQQIAKLQAAMKACATKDISDQGSKLLKTHVTEALAAALTDEQKQLGITSIPISLSDRTSKAVIKHSLKLNGATLAADTSAVLSEGEHRAVALAAFMAELKMYPGKDSIIIDDPVSSLDHVRREKVAERLVAEARDRQVIVFTHDLVFLSEARFHATKNRIPIRVLGIRRGPNGFGSLDPDGEPWLAKHLAGRRQWLTEQLARLKKMHAEASADYEPQLRFFYDRLRESWEKFIEERLFAQVVSRFQPQVQTQRLKEAVLDDELVSQVYFGMTAVSSYTGHDRPAGKGGAFSLGLQIRNFHLKSWRSR
jgi:energy-coupling factor transporter ATP-binding protein EcfA2